MKEKYIFKEERPDYYNSEYYFDGDCFSENAGDFCYTLFILYYNRGYHGLNIKTFADIQWQAQHIQEGFSDIENDYENSSYKDMMEYYGVQYNSHKCHKLREWSKQDDVSSVDAIADYLTITTGEKWSVKTVYGYCQGDCVDVLFCEKFYTVKNAKEYGEIWLGCAKEFVLIYLDEKGEEKDKFGGYYVADSIAYRDEDIKKYLCECEGIQEEETRLELFDGFVTTASYRTV